MSLYYKDGIDREGNDRNITYIKQKGTPVHLELHRGSVSIYTGCYHIPHSKNRKNTHTHTHTQTNKQLALAKTMCPVNNSKEEIDYRGNKHRLTSQWRIY